MKSIAHQIEPARCKRSMLPAEVFEAMWPSKTTHAERKEDGIRYLLQVCPNGATHNFLTSRRISDITSQYVEKQDKLPSIKNHSFPVRWRDTVLDGEVISLQSGATSAEAQHAVATGSVTYVVWDVLRYCGSDVTTMPLFERRALLDIMLAEHRPAWLRPVDHSNNPHALLRKVFDEGGEGIILKNLNASYGVHWTKVKGVETHDCIITGYDMSTEGKYYQAGWIKNIRLGQWLICNKPTDLPKGAVVLRNRKVGKVNWVLLDVGRASGFDDKQRADFTKNQKAYLDQPVEIKCQLRLPSGMFRHPRFNRLRPDKPPEQCIAQLKPGQI